MSLKFSLKDLLLLTALISVACAALANAGIWWHSIVVTATLSGMTGLVIWGTLHRGSRGAFAAGWLLVSVAYLSLIFAPSVTNNLGAHLITTKGLALLEARALGNQPSPPVLPAAPWMDLNANYNGVVDYSYVLNLTAGPYALAGNTLWSSATTNGISTFQSTGHWLIASTLGFCGGHLAAFLWLRRSGGTRCFPREGGV